MPMITVPPTEEELWRAADIRKALQHLQAALDWLSDEECMHKAIVRRAIHLLEKRAAKLEAGAMRWIPAPEDAPTRDPYADAEQRRERARAEGRMVAVRTGD